MTDCAVGAGTATMAMSICWVAITAGRSLVESTLRWASSRPNLVGVVVEGRDDAEALRAESGVVDDGPPQAPHADHGGVPFPVEPQDAAQLADKVAHVVAAALFTESSEVAQVFPYLRRRDAEPVAELARADHLGAVVAELGQHPHVERQTQDDDFGDILRNRVFLGQTVAGSGWAGAPAGSFRQRWIATEPRFNSRQSTRENPAAPMRPASDSGPGNVLIEAVR